MGGSASSPVEKDSAVQHDLWGTGPLKRLDRQFCLQLYSLKLAQLSQQLSQQFFCSSLWPSRLSLWNTKGY